MTYIVFTTDKAAISTLSGNHGLTLGGSSPKLLEGALPHQLH